MREGQILTDFIFFFGLDLSSPAATFPHYAVSNFENLGFSAHLTRAVAVDRVPEIPRYLGTREIPGTKKISG